jgi:uncharacterized membrane protein YeaQ/YmgE (transglycosylase-associated protein family)
MDGIVGVIISLVSGAVGGNIAGGVLDEHSLGPIGNSLAGIVGGGVAGPLLSALGGSRGVSPDRSISAGGFDLGRLVGQVAGGGVGGAVLMIIVGLIKQAVVR